jgi:hypothetical protein
MWLGFFHRALLSRVSLSALANHGQSSNLSDAGILRLEASMRHRVPGSFRVLTYLDMGSERMTTSTSFNRTDTRYWTTSMALYLLHVFHMITTRDGFPAPVSTGCLEREKGWRTLMVLLGRCALSVIVYGRARG